MRPEDAAAVLADPNNVRVMESVIREFGMAIPTETRKDIMHSAVVRCLRKYDGSLGNKLTTSLHRFTAWECRNFLRGRKRAARRPASFRDVPEPASPAVDRREDIDHVRECMGMLRPADRLLVEQRFLMGMTYREIGVLHGYTRAAACQNVRRALGRLRRICLRTG